ncbi:MAG: thiamine phosphate synthase [Myxococcota bacterium]
MTRSFDAGVDWLQVRERSGDTATLLEIVDLACSAARPAKRPARVIVNRRLDVALAAGADGVHLGFDAVPPGHARTLLGSEAVVGFSAHAPEELARTPDISYAHLAPIFDPLSKPAERPALGLAVLRKAARHGVPVLAQGGIDLEHARPAIEAGASGVAITGLLSSASDPSGPARALREILDV